MVKTLIFIIDDLGVSSFIFKLLVDSFGCVLPQLHFFIMNLSRSYIVFFFFQVKFFYFIILSCKRKEHKNTLILLNLSSPYSVRI